MYHFDGGHAEKKVTFLTTFLKRQTVCGATKSGGQKAVTHAYIREKVNYRVAASYSKTQAQLKI
jgi:hypothetical protein